ncbi:MAG TPA: ABC transporter ATP-binding protein [Blastocatellia bacterium]|nr:ABC transporter ATP-binding protein [Blastocatellia bacterium]
MSSETTEDLLEVRELKKYYQAGRGLGSGPGDVVKAVDGLTLMVRRGETFGLVGESGCGKSTTGRCILRLTEPTAGQILFEGRDLTALDRPRMRELRKDMQIVFQDPYSSLNPRMRVGDIVGEPLVIHRIGARSERKNRVLELLKLVGLPPDHANRFPHEFSGGQRQRIGIARALALSPKFIVCDEPVSALDVSVQAQIVNLLQDLQDELSLTYLFISHGLAVVRQIADRVGIMFQGRLVEAGPADEIFRHPLHPYTRALLAAIPDIGQSDIDPMLNGGRPVTSIETANERSSNVGCRFRSRCPLAEPRCGEREPELEEANPGHKVACFVVASDGRK